MDGLRGIAVLLVLMHHIMLYGGLAIDSYLDLQVRRILMSGWVGVDLFFVLSGFLITGILLDSKQTRRYFGNFYARRVLRIFPLYYGFLVLYLFVLPEFVSFDPTFDTLKDGQLWYWIYLTNVDIGLNGWPAFKGLGHFWTLAVEEQFYLIWPVVVFLLPRRKLAQACGALILFSIAFRLGMVFLDMRLAAYVLTPARVDTLAVGSLLAVIWRSDRGKILLSRLTLPTLLVSGAGLASLFVWYRGLYSLKFGMLTIGYTATALFFGSLLVISVTAPKGHVLNRLCGSGVLRFFGRYSYAIYVFHHLVVLYVPQHWFSVQDIPVLLGSQIPGLIVFGTVVTAISVALALLSWHVLESPMLKLKRYFVAQRVDDHPLPPIRRADSEAVGSVQVASAIGGDETTST